MDILEYLKGYQHVADFQQLCGVEIVEADKIVHKNGGINEQKEEVSATKSNSVSNSHANGVKKRNGKCDSGIESNGLLHRNGSFTNGITNPEENEVKLAYKIHNKWLYYLMVFGAGLGSEYFYIIFFPFMMWNVDSKLCRQLLIIWAPLMYFGQFLKDCIQWPRPGPPAVRLEGKRFEKEYGFPSTHTIVGTCIPFSLLVLTSKTFEYPFCIGLVIATVWTLLVACSRVYLGMHTVVDCMAGITLTGLALPWMLSMVEYWDFLLVTLPCAPFFNFLIPLMACIYYPKPKVWSITRGDTSNIVSIASMVLMSTWFTYQLGWAIVTPVSHELLPFPEITGSWVLYSLLRTLLGVVALASSRIVSKKMFVKLVCYCVGVDTQDIARQRELGLEVPVRWLTIGGLAVNTAFTAPLCFTWLGINRPGFYTEVGI